MKFTTKRPRYSGIYLIEQDGDYEIVTLFYDKQYRDWSITDYPDCRVTSPLEDFDNVKWGPRVSK